VVSDANENYGRVLDTRKFALALRWAALDADNQTVLAGVRANLAQDVDEMLAAFALHHSPMQNLVVADTTGRTAYQAIGRVPVRHPDNDLRGMAPAPGWEARYDWTGWLGAAETPRVDHAAIAAKGWHATANQRIHAADYPHFIGADWNTPERYDRIETLLAATPKHTPQTLRAVQADTLSLATNKLLPVLQATASSHALAPAALERLKAFDGDMKADSAAALVFAYWADELTRALIAPKLGEARFKSLYGKRTFRAGLQVMLLDPQASAFWCGPSGCAGPSSRALGAALDRIAAEQGTDVAAWRWGRAHPALSSHKPFGNVAALARYFDVSVATPGDPWTVNVGQYWANDPKLPFANRHAASLRAIYDLADPEQSTFIYQTGQSGLVFSPRYRDMRDEWAQVRSRPLQLQPREWAHQARLLP
jgi:penicillin amidase